MRIRTGFGSIFTLIPIFCGIYCFFSKQYSIMLNSLFSSLCVAVFILIHKKFPFLGKRTYYASIIFILLSVFAGRTFNFYGIIPFWDKSLHFISGFIAVSAAKQLYFKLNKTPARKVFLNLFAFSLAASAACLWEIYEFFSDWLFGTTAQNNSLTDTMWDMILGTAGSALALILPAITSRYKTKQNKTVK